MSAAGFLKKLLGDAEVEWVPLGHVTQPTANIKWSEADGVYRYIDLTSVDIKAKRVTETIEISAETAPSRAQKLVKENDVIFATTRPAQQRYCLINSELAGNVASTGYCVLRAKQEQALPRWILHWLSTTEFKNYVEENQSGAAYPAISDGKVKAFKIPIPCTDDPEKSLAIQGEIVRILDTFTELSSELTAELTAELTQRKKQYDHYRDQLLTFDDDEVEWKTLGDIGRFTYGYAAVAKARGDARFIRITDIGTNGKLIADEKKFVSVCKENKKYLLKRGDLLMARTGATFGKTMIFDQSYPAIFAGFLIKLDLRGDVVDPKYYWHFAQSDMFWSQANGLVSGGGQPQFNANTLKQVRVPIPFPDDPEKSLDEQARIVAILDKFDSLADSLNENLPREIALRKRQYAFYRDQLLSFPKPDVEAV